MNTFKFLCINFFSTKFYCCICINEVILIEQIATKKWNKLTVPHKSDTITLIIINWGELMKGSELYSKTLKFVWLKLGLNLLTILTSVIWLAICFGLLRLFGGEGIFIMLLLWLSGTVGINFAVNHYIGYLVKAGHIAVITYAIKHGRLPENQIEYAKKTVKERFVQSSAFFVVDRLISGAVSQIQHTVGKIDMLLGNIPGVSTIVSLVNTFIGIALNYVDECCLSYSFYQEEENNVFKSSVDGVVIYFQNWKRLLKNAAKLVLVVVVTGIIDTIISYTLIGALFSTFGWNRLFAFIIAIFIAGAIKKAFIDSYLCIDMMTEYLEVAPTTEITFHLYEKLCGLSAKFRTMFEKAGISGEKNMSRTAAYQTTAATLMNKGEQQRYSSNQSLHKNCPNCNKPLAQGNKFCGYCGHKMDY